MRSFTAIALVVGVTGCPGEGVDDPGADAASRTCSMPEMSPDVGALTASFAQRCNVSGSMGARKWYRIAATLPDSTDVVQIELYDQAGAFAGGTVQAGTFPVETSFGSCGVCLRGLGDKGEATQKEYFGTGGMVTVTAPGVTGTAFSATVTGAQFVEVDATSHAPVADGCTSAVAGAALTGTLMDRGGTGGGGGGGGGGGACPTTIGDADRP